MFRKLTAILLTAVMLASMVVPGAFAQDSGNASGNEIVIFEDDFEKGNMFFHILPDWVYANGQLTSPLSVGANTYFSQKDSVKYRDYTVEYVFSVDAWNPEVSSAWTGIIIREDVCFYFKNNEVRYWDMAEGKDEFMGNMPIELGTDYRVRVTAQDKYIQVFAKKEGASYYTDCGTFVDMTPGKGHIYFRSIASTTNIKEVKLSVPSNNDMCFTKYGLAEIGENEVMFKNTQNKPVTFKTSDESIAEITADGKLNVKKKGVFTVTAYDAEDRELDKAAYSGCVYVDAIDFAMGARDMYVGDTMDVRAYYSPTSADVKATIWASSDPSVVEIVGKGERIGVRALKPGTSVITAKLAYGGSVRDTAWLTLTVKEKADPGTGTATFAATGVNHEIPPYFFGIAQGDRCALNSGEAYARPEMIEVVKDAGYNITRVPGGGLSCYFDWRTGKVSTASYNGEFQGFTMEDIYELANECDIPAVYCLNTSSNYNSPEDIVECITEIKKNTNQPIFVELINEAYAASSIWPEEWQTVDGFCAEMDKYYKAIKEAHPDVVVATVGLSKDMEKRILADPNNTAFENTEDWEYTTPGRVRYWNRKLAAGGAYDTVAIHPYTHQTQITCTTQDEYMKNHFAFNQDIYLNLLLSYREFGNKPLWLTEWGDIEEERMSVKDAAVSTRMLNVWDVGIAISDGERLMQMLKTGVVEITNYWDITGSSGFGISPYWSDNKLNDYVTKQTRFYVFKELGKILNSNTHYHDITGVDVGYEIMDWPWSNNGSYVVNLPDVSAHALGTADSINNVVFVNHTDKEMTVSVDGLQLSRQVSWGDAENNFPDYMVKPSRSGYTPLTENIVPPTTYEEGYSDTITIPGFSLVIAGAQGTAVLKTDTVAGKISKINEYELNHTVVLSPGKNTAYVNNVKAVVDENVNVVPVVKNGRTLLPLRFVSESMGAQVDYVHETGKITVTLGDTTAEFELGNTVYFVNGEKFILDVPAETENSRTLIPLRALAEALGKTVYWDDRGLIVVSNVSTSFHEPYNELDPGVFTEIIALFDGEQ